MWILNSIFAALCVFLYAFIGVIFACICRFDDRKDFIPMMIFWPFAVVIIIGITICFSIDKLINKIIHKLRRK